MSGADLALELRGLTVRYRGPLWGPRPAPVVDGVDLQLRRGETLALVGESGSGKTSLARASLGLLPVERGLVRVLGEDWLSLSRDERRRRRGRAQLLLQSADASLNPNLRVGEQLRESARLHRPDQAPGALARETLERVGLASRERAWPHELSGGEKRRVGVAMALLPDPELLIADEPTSGLDASLKASLLDHIAARRAEGRALLLITHDLPAALYVADRVAVMHGGRILEDFAPADLLKGPHHPYTWSLMAASALSTLLGS